MQIWTDFVCYNRVLFVITGKNYHKNGLNQPKYFFVRYNRVFVITEFVITEFDCICGKSQNRRQHRDKKIIDCQ
jgi:hypothetical protein